MPSASQSSAMMDSTTLELFSELTYTAKAQAAVESYASDLQGRERQLLVLMMRNDAISRMAIPSIVAKVNLCSLVARGYLCHRVGDERRSLIHDDATEHGMLFNRSVGDRSSVGRASAPQSSVDSTAKTAIHKIASHEMTPRMNANSNSKDAQVKSLSDRLSDAKSSFNKAQQNRTAQLYQLLQNSERMPTSNTSMQSEMNNARLDLAIHYG